MPWRYSRQVTALIRLVCLYALLFYLGLEIALTLRDVRESETTLLSAPLPPATAPAAQIPRLGVSVALEQHPDSAARQQALDRLRQAGFGWVRQRFDWNALEPQPGQFQWAQADAILDDIRAAGLVPVVVLDGSPAWARDPRDRPPQDNPLAPPADPRTFARFASAFAQRYGGSVRFYQIWDEPNIAPHWGNRLIDPVGYAQLLRQAATAVRAADPDAVILAAALAPTRDRGHTAIDEGYFLQRMYAANASPFFDAVLVQPFGFGTGPDDLRSRRQVLNFRRVLWVRRVMLDAGDGRTPIWAVRFGWNRQPNSQWKAVSPADQRRFAQEAIRHAQAHWPWLAALGWPLDRPAQPLADPLWGFALIEPDGQPAPLLAAFAPALSAGAEEAPPVPPAPVARLILLLFFFGAVLVWAIASLARLPLAAWQSGFRGWPLEARLAVWAGLVFVYYVAVWPPLIVLCWLLAAFLIAAEPVMGLGLAALLLPFHFQHKEIPLVGTVWTVPPAQAALLATLPALLGAFARSRKVRVEAWLQRLGPTDWLVLSLLGLSFLSGLNVWHLSGYAAGLWALVLVPALLYAAVRLFVGTSRQRRGLLLALFAGGVLAAILGLLDWLAGGGVAVDGVRRLMGVSFSPNQTALYLLRTIFVGAGLWMAAAQRLRRLRRQPGGSLTDIATRTRHLRILPRYQRLLLPGCGLALVALLLTASRGAILLGLPVGGAVLAVALARRSRFLRIWLPMAVLALLAFGLVAVALLGPRLWNSATVLARLGIWQAGLKMWSYYFLLGVGPGGFFWNYPAFIALGPGALSLPEPNLLHPHAVWLEFATGWGVLGLLWLAGLLLWLGWLVGQAWRGRLSWFQVGVLAGLWAGLAHGLVDAFAGLPELAAWNLIALALLHKPKGDG